jgi:hypothetical protein
MPAKPANNSPKGVVFLTTNAEENTVLLEPHGIFDDITLFPVLPIWPRSSITLDVRDAAANRRLYYGDIADMPAIIHPGGALRISWEDLEAAHFSSGPFLTFQATPKSLQNRFCPQTYQRKTPLVIEDGSAAEEYAPGSDCRWLVSAPSGEHLRFKFEFLDTEPRTDLIYLFAGDGTHAPIIAVVSGSAIPETITAPVSEALVWFVSDLKNQRQGFRLRVEAIPARQ